MIDADVRSGTNRGRRASPCQKDRYLEQGRGHVFIPVHHPPHTRCREPKAHSI